MAMMDLDDFRTVLDSCGVDVWTFIDSAIAVASLDYGGELKHRRDGIVERLYVVTSPAQPRCQKCDDLDNRRPNDRYEVKDSEGKNSGGHEGRERSPPTPESVERDDAEDLDPYAGLFNDEQKKILEIKEHLEDPDQVSFLMYTDCSLIFQL